MNIVLLDADTIGRDIDLSIFNKLGNVRIYGFSTDDEMRDRVADADVIILNKMKANAYTLSKASRLKLVCVTATGTNNLDKDYLDQHGAMWQDTLLNASHSIHLPCCFTSWKSCRIMITM